MGKSKEKKVRKCRNCGNSFYIDAKQLKSHAQFCNRFNWESDILKKPTLKEVLTACKNPIKSK